MKIVFCAISIRAIQKTSSQNFMGKGLMVVNK